MDKKLHEYPHRKTVDVQGSQASSSVELPTSSTNLAETTTTGLDKRSKKRKKAKSDHSRHGSRNIWKNLSQIFTKSSCPTEPTSDNLLEDKEKGSTFRRLSSIFKHQNSSSNATTPISNIGVSPIGYQAIVSEKRFTPSEEKEIAMAVRLPSGSDTRNVAVTVELEVLKKDEESVTDDRCDEAMVMKCCEETESKTIFTGILKVPPDTDLSKLSNMPLYIVDSQEQLVFNPGAEMSLRKLIRPSEDMLLNDSEDYAISMGTLKVKVTLDKIKEPENGEQFSINNDNDLTMNIPPDESHDKEEPITQLPFTDTINVLDEVYALAHSEDVITAVELKNYQKSTSWSHIRDIFNISPEKKTTLSEVRSVLESANHMQGGVKGATDLKHIHSESATYALEKSDGSAITAGIKKSPNESDQYAVASAFVDNTLDSPKASSIAGTSGMRTKQVAYGNGTTDNYDDVEQESSTGHNEDQYRENSTEQFQANQVRISQHYALVEKPSECGQSAPTTKKTIRDSSTQYSNSYFTTDKEVEVQCSFILPNHGIFNENDNFRSPAASSSQTILLPFRKYGNLINNIHQASNSYDSSETVMPGSTTTTTTTTAYSSTLLSEFSFCYDNDLKVPLNSPNSTMYIPDDHKEIKYVPNVLDLLESNQHTDEVTNIPVSYGNMNLNSSRHNEQQTNDSFSNVSSLNDVERKTLQESSPKCSSTEEELYLIDFDTTQEELNFQQNLDLASEQKADRKAKKDKTLELLKEVRLKLESYLIRTGNSRKVDKSINQQSIDWCGLFINHNNLDGLAKKFTDVRNVSVSCNNPFNPYGFNNDDIKKRCYEDDDEYYESKRSNVRRYFQNDNLGLLMENVEIKKNFDFYLSGDNFNTKVNFGSTNYQAYPLSINNKLHVRSLKSQAQMKLDESYANTLLDSQTNKTTTLPARNTRINYDLGIKNSIHFKLETELNTLQQMYDSMCSHMKFLLDVEDNATPSAPKQFDSQSTIKSLAIESISEDLTSNLHELKYCLSTINQILAKSTNSLQDINATLPSAWELFPTASDILRNSSVNDNLVKRIEPVSGLKNNAITIPTGLEPFSTIFGENLSKRVQPPSSSKTINTIGSNVAETFPMVSDMLENHSPHEYQDQQHQSSCFKNIDTIMPTVLESLSDLFRDSLSIANQPNQIQPSGSTSVYTVSGLLPNPPSKENQIVCVPRSRSKNIYTVLPTAAELTTTISDLLGEHLPKEIPIQSSSFTSAISDLLRKDSHKEIAAEQIQMSNSSQNINNIIPTATELFPTIFEIFGNHSVETTQAKQGSFNIMEPFPTISDNPTSATSSECINSIMPTGSELFPTVCNLVWDFSPISSQTKLAHFSSSLNNVDVVSPTASQPVPTISDCLPKETETIVDKKACISSSERSDTYFVMESEIERTIKELLKESGDIKEAVILNGGKEEAEPSFSVEYVNIANKDDPLVICRKIIEDVVDSSSGQMEYSTQNKNECGGAREDVKHILDALLNEIDKTEILVDKKSNSKKSLEAVNFLYDTYCKESGKNCANIQIGDANNKPTSSKFDNIKNDCFTCFCSTATFTSKIPKTSFSFGETPSACFEIPYSDCKTPVRRRVGQEKRDRLFNELLNLQSDMNDYEKNQTGKSNDSLSEEEFSSAQDIVEKFQEDATVSDMLEYSVSNENKATQLQEVPSNKPTHTLQMAPCKTSAATSLMESENGNSAENCDSEDNSPNASPKNEEQRASNQGSNRTISNSQKCVQLTNSMNKDIPKNQPSTSKRPPKYTSTTEEEEIIQNVDLTTNQYDSSTEPGYFIPDKASGFTQKSSHSQAQSIPVYDSSSEEEIVSHATRKPRSKKKNAQIEEIKPKTSIVSDSDSEQFPKIKQPMINSDQGLMSLNSHIVLKPVDAVVNLQEKMNGSGKEKPSDAQSAAAGNSDKTRIISKAVSIADLSSENERDASDTEYEGDHETTQIKLPNPRRRFKSIQELNTPEEIAKIEKNIKENDKLHRSGRIVLVSSETSSQLEYEDSSLGSRSEISVNIKHEDSGESNIVDVDNAKEATVGPTVEPSKSRSTI